MLLRFTGNQNTIPNVRTEFNIAIARQIFQNKVFFFTSWGSFPIKNKKKSFYEKFAGRQQ
jgi:hypothetical protein